MFDLSKYIYSSGSVESYKEKDFTPAEQAVIIVLSNKCSLEEKLQDLQILIDDYTDEAVCKEVTLLIQLWNKILNDRYNNAGVIFLANLQEYGVENDKLSAYRFFSSYDTALDFLQKEKSCLEDTNTYGEIWRMEVDTDDPECDIYYFGNDMKLSNIVCCSDRPVLEDMKLFRFVQYIPNADLDYSIKAELKKMI